MAILHLAIKNDEKDRNNQTTTKYQTERAKGIQDDMDCSGFIAHLYLVYPIRPHHATSRNGLILS